MNKNYKGNTVLKQFTKNNYTSTYFVKILSKVNTKYKKKKNVYVNLKSIKIKKYQSIKNIFKN